MSVKVHEAFSIDSFQDRLLWWDDFLGDQLQDEWRSNGTGSAIVVDAQTGGIVRITCGAVNGNAHQIDWTNIRTLLITKKASLEVRYKPSTDLLVHYTMALWGPFPDWTRFIYDTGLGHSNWNIETREAGGTTTQDSGIAPDSSAYHIFRIECFPTGEVHFYIDGVETANSPITTNIPTAHLQPYLYVQTRENATKSADIDYVVVRQEI